MADDIFKYAPVSEWNGMIVDFGMPSTDGDIRLTEICRAADTCLEASKNATALSFTNSAFVKARGALVQKIIRTLFGEKPGVTIRTFAAVGEDGAIHFMSPIVVADMQIYSKNWAYEIVNNYMNIGLTPILFSQNLPPVFVGNHQSPIRVYTRRRTEALNPLAVGLITTGNRPVTGNWATDGEPYVEINWESISTGRCTDNVTTNQTACEQVILGGVCREQQPGRGYCSDSTYRNNESGCLNANETWSSSVGTPPRCLDMPSGNLVEANIDYAGDYYCTYASTTGYTNGRCFWSWNNLDTETWHAWSTGTSEDLCLDWASNNWPNRFWMWIPPGNVWTNQYAVWRPSYDGNHTHSGWLHPHEIPGTVDSWKHFNIKTANNHRKYPINHVPSQTGTNLRIYHSDTNSSWGNGTEVGRSTIPTWVTNTFDWDDNEHAYDVCHDTSNNLVTLWDTPALCVGAGHCWEMNTTSPVYPNSPEYTNFINDEAACIAQTTGCYPGPIAGNHIWNNETDCLAAGWCMGNSNYDNNSSACNNWGACGCDASWNSTQCANAGHGNCESHFWFGTYQYACPQFNNDPAGCAAWNSGGQHCHWVSHNCPWNTAWFLPVGNDWHTQNHWASDNYTWSAEIPIIEVEIDISVDYRWDLMFPPHTFVDTTDSRPLYEQGYTSSYTVTALHASQSQIRWKPPQTDQADYLRTYPRPSKFRIYRAPAVYRGLTSNTDFTEEIWKLAGEVTTSSDSGYHYFYDTRENMVKEGLMEFQQAYYGITAVWEDWNWKRGFTIKYYANLDCSAWDIHDGQSWSATINYGGNPNYIVYYDGLCSNNNYTTEATCLGNGACIGNSDYNNNETLCLSFGTCTDPTYDNDEAGCNGVFGTWTTLYVWSSANYTWTPGTWSGTPNTGANLDYVENATPNVTYLQKHVRINNDTDNRTYRASGYFKAPVAGEYQFEIRADDSAYVWLGPDQQSVSGLIGQRTWYNYLAAVPGDHGDRWHTGTISLVKDGIYPFLAYQANETGPATFEIRIHYPDGDWNDGGNGAGEWKYVPILMGPEDMVLEDGGGQTVEGHWANTSVPAWYTNFP